ncbi:hypothetical protein DTO217A2_5148 [Paecilomyces variotii]|nr:hypothetical protein DTO217A2_5148 [Paecilomyces variotii]
MTACHDPASGKRVATFGCRKYPSHLSEPVGYVISRATRKRSAPSGLTIKELGQRGIILFAKVHLKTEER